MMLAMTRCCGRWSLVSRALAMIALAFAACPSQAADPPAGADALRARYAELEPRLRQNPFNRPLVMESVEGANQVSGQVYAVVNYPFASVSSGLNNPANWCDIFILHINTKYCHASTANQPTTLAVYIGKKTPQPLEDAHRTDFQYRPVSVTPEFLDIRLSARDGPFGTSDYRVVLQAVALGDNRTFLHLSYAYGYNFAAKVSMSTYLATIGSRKVGFSTRAGSGKPVGGMRGLIERNTMRYYLAIDAFLGAREAPPAEQLEKRLQSWFSAVEHYPLQLREMERAEYLAIKREEYRRQQAAQ